MEVYKDFNSTTKLKWPKEQIKQLAKELEYHPCLWDKENRDYRNGISKLNAKKKMAERMGVSLQAMDVKIKCIIFQYYRELKKQTVIDKYKSKWYLFPYLNYLQSSFNPTFDQIAQSQSDDSDNTPTKRTKKSKKIPTNHGNNDIHNTSNQRSVKSDHLVPFEDSDHSNGAEFGDISISSLVAIQYDDDDDDNEPEKFNHGDEAELPQNLTINRINSLDNLKSIVSSTDQKKPTCISITTDEKKSAFNISNTPTEEEDEWDVFGRLVAHKIRQLKSGILKMQAEADIHFRLLQIQAQDNGTSIIPEKKKTIF